MSLAGITLETKEGTKVPAAEALRGKIVVLFFSSEWCPACKLFVPTLHTLHEVARENEARYMAKSHGDWLSVPFEDTATRDALKAKVLCFYSLHRQPRVGERYEPPLGLATQRVQRVAAAVLAEEQEGIGEPRR
ncbi:hypothetical protein EMIHUDRAFT_104940 [Emiliania huxleyi CCMP1516]|uniref:Alkyl hydroperoxide reductase subunit C/ Thiol specific antioxidant domain-containing protein n=2 Tax=Emiliania huxleyi TaxID=2903 RepID=A0A0D3IHV6_EMIH1|nr:hypothetical protein EMIHUDRAFT_104940 [Emiliania huxleyi CCMP1516]EOD10841.1 hypothetical protein EMIHUDRAFT_104940 [Emiliania huxleyi CCMP1516]|eukprot:XP_005763270.1 hypothetical protein EMIHUDRAFT_104940 [Emiliania huxleyi CCMP1516]